MTHTVRIALALLAFSTLGCEASFEVETQSDAIVGGAPTSGHPAVAFLVAVDTEGNEYFTCSGTLIAADAVLTAAHCVDDPQIGGFFVYFGTTFVGDDSGEIFSTWAREGSWHSGWTGEISDGADIAILLLEDPVPVAPIPFMTAPITDSMLGSSVDIVGWGITGGGRDDDRIKRAVTSSLFGYDDMYIEDGNGITNSCNGDSGGPAFMNIGGVKTVVGVTSYGDQNCEEYGAATRVDAYLPFIYDMLGIDGGPDDDDGTPGGFGSTCDGGSDCDSGLCVDRGNGVGFCTTSCNSDSQCGSGFECMDTSSDISVCFPGDNDDDNGFGGGGGGGNGLPFGCSAAGSDSTSLMSFLLVLGLAALGRRRRHFTA